MTAFDPSWPERDQLDRPVVVRVRNERLPDVVNLDERIGA